MVISVITLITITITSITILSISIVNINQVLMELEHLNPKYTFDILPSLVVKE